MSGIEEDAVTIAELQGVIDERQWVFEDILMKVSLRPLFVVLTVGTLPDIPRIYPILIQDPGGNALVDRVAFQYYGPIAWSVPIIEPVVDPFFPELRQDGQVDPVVSREDVYGAG